MIAPGAWLGLLGGGQLGRMFSMAAQSMGYRVMVVDPGPHSPAGDVADACLRADYLDPLRSSTWRAIALRSRPSSRTFRPRRSSAWRRPAS